MTDQTPEIWFFKPQSIIGSVVDFITRGKYSHCGVAHTIDGIKVFTDAHPVRGVACRPVRLVPAYDICINLDSIDMQWMNRTLAMKWGLSYGFLDVLGFVIGGSRDHKGIICSELVVDVIDEAIRDGKSVKNGAAVSRLNAARTSPAALLATLQATN